MRCVNPFVKAGEVYPCGQCLSCKFRAARIWRNRIILEASQHEFNSVVTLTYSESSLPAGGELQCVDLTNWLKRVRKRFNQRTGKFIRFYACGEYGEKSLRPHYHVVLFGYPSCEAFRTGRQWCGECPCVNCIDVAKTWPIGAASLDRLSRESASYVSGYVSRKVLSRAPLGKQLPFTRQSTRPGLGANAMKAVAHTIRFYGMESNPLPTAIVQGTRPMLLGRFLRRKLADALCVEPDVVPFNEAPMQAVRRVAWEASISQKEVYRQINEPYDSQLRQKEASKEKVL